MKMKRHLAGFATTAILAILGGTLIVSNARELLVEHVGSRVNGTRTIASWRSDIVGRIPVMGDPTARMTIIEFSDYQCPYCAVADPVLVEFVARHPSDVVVYRYDMPLTEIHQYAFAASIAANCAEAQGVGEPYQSVLFLHQNEFSTLDWTEVAKQSGVKDSEAFTRCVKGDKSRGHILKDVEIGKSLGISGTPSLIINGSLHTNGVSEEMLESLWADMYGKHHGFMRWLMHM